MKPIRDPLFLIGAILMALLIPFIGNRRAKMCAKTWHRFVYGEARIMKLKPNEIPERWRKQIAAQGVEIRQKPKRVKKEPVNPAWFTGKEKDLQKMVESWLSKNGFAKRTKKAIMETNGAGGTVGWQLHFPRNIGNPYLGDILLLRHDGQYLELELKTATGELSDLQAMLFTTPQSEHRVCRCLEDVVWRVAQWK
jgi:hypothetical protein